MNNIFYDDNNNKMSIFKNTWAMWLQIIPKFKSQITFEVIRPYKNLDIDWVKQVQSFDTPCQQVLSKCCYIIRKNKRFEVIN